MVYLVLIFLFVVLIYLVLCMLFDGVVCWLLLCCLRVWSVEDMVFE